ncbi:UPF0104 family protein [Georgenia subflava]|uniref:UPF0104 family protein n=1 Tax=Georgenia subflava TaxID=1622177 RepID=A0A6N7EPK4_9MICO|nr:UPF0104 family protein [Georgenia subflava]
MGRLLAVLRAPAVRAGFVVLALGACVWALVSQWDDVTDAVSTIPGGTLLGATGLSLVYVSLTMLSWRAVLADLGSRLPLRTASSVFFVSQVGKYLPGGIWNVLAAAEMGADHQIPRRRSVSVMVVSILVSIVTGLALAVLAVALAPGAVADRYGWVAWALPVVLVVLLPPVLNRLLGVALRVTRRPALEEPMTARGIATAAVWALLAWLVAGAQVWLLATAVGMDETFASFALAVGGYALAWTVGFLVVVVPAGVGAREAVLAVVLAGQLDAGGVVVVVLLSRVLLTVADVGLGSGGLLLARTSARRLRERPRSDQVGS